MISVDFKIITRSQNGNDRRLCQAGEDLCKN